MITTAVAGGTGEAGAGGAGGARRHGAGGVCAAARSSRAEHGCRRNQSQRRRRRRWKAEQRRQWRRCATGGTDSVCGRSAAARWRHGETSSRGGAAVYCRRLVRWSHGSASQCERGITAQENGEAVSGSVNTGPSGTRSSVFVPALESPRRSRTGCFVGCFVAGQAMTTSGERMRRSRLSRGTV